MPPPPSLRTGMTAFIMTVIGTVSSNTAFSTVEIVGVILGSLGSTIAIVGALNKWLIRHDERRRTQDILEGSGGTPSLVKRVTQIEGRMSRLDDLEYKITRLTETVEGLGRTFTEVTRLIQKILASSEAQNSTKTSHPSSPATLQNELESLQSQITTLLARLSSSPPNRPS